MWETILSIIIKYWVEFFLGLIVAGGSLFFKRYAKLEKAERKRTQDEHYAKLAENIKENNQKLIEHFSVKYNEGLAALDNQYKEMQETFKQKDEMAFNEHNRLDQKVDEVNDNYDILKNGILSLQGSLFKDECRKLLKEDHVITLDEWEEIDAMHDIYNALGGNHNGDYLYQLVSEKVKNTLTD